MIIINEYVKKTPDGSTLIGYRPENESDTCIVICFYGEPHDAQGYAHLEYILSKYYNSLKYAQRLVHFRDRENLSPIVTNCRMAVRSRTPRTYKGGKMSAPEVAMKKENVKRCFIFENNNWSFYEDI